MKLMKAQRCKIQVYNSSEAIVTPAWGVKGVWVEGAACLSATGFPKWTFVDGRVSSARTRMAER